MVANVLAIIFVATFQYFLAIDRASALACSSMDEAFANMRKAFKAIMKAEDAQPPLGAMAGAVAAGSGFNVGAKIEPRFWRKSWRGAYYDEVVIQMNQLRLDVLMLWFAMAGSDGKPDAIFSKFNKQGAFHEVEEDLNSTLEDAHELVVAVASRESGALSGLSK